MIVSFIFTQAFLTLLSLPVLIAWGLPLSLWSFLGNFLFGPVLSLYLLCAVLLFFTELLCIPNYIFVWCVEAVGKVWMWCMSLLSSSAVIGFVRPPFFVLCMLPAITCTCLWLLRRHSDFMRALCFTILLFTCCFGLKLFVAPQYGVHTIQDNDMQITMISTNRSIVLVADDTSLARKPSSENWLVYQMMSEVVVRTGASQIDSFVILHPRQRIFDAVGVLSQHVMIKKLYVPWWEGRLSGNAWRAYARMKYRVQQTGGVVQSLGKSLQILDGDSQNISLQKIDGVAKYQQSCYPLYVFLDVT